MNRDLEKMLSVTTEICREDEKMARSMDTMGKGMRSIYMLSLLETCEETKEGDGCDPCGRIRRFTCIRNFRE